MKRIYVATKSRGFLFNLFSSEYKDISFTYEDNKLYETNSKTKLFLSRLVKSKFADHLGLIQRVKVKEKSYDVAFSYNRFLRSENDYVIYLENPLALIHYSTYRNKTLLSKYKLRKFLNDPNLKAIICLSKSCYETLNNFYNIPSGVKVEQIYPLIENRNKIDEESIRNKCNQKELNCLYISSNFNLKGGKDILECFKKFKYQGIENIKLKIITKTNSLDEGTLNEIKNNRNISLFDFNLNKEELNKIYDSTCILLNPTRQDSFPLVILEAIKSGNVIITTDLYAIPEMVKDNFNGFLTNPRYRFYNYDNMPNESVWNNREETIYSDYIDNNIVEFLFKKIEHLNINRGELERLSLNSFKMSDSEDFNSEIIKQKWNKLLSHY